MRAVLRSAGLILLLVVPAYAADKDDKGKGSDQTATEQDYKQLKQITDLSGTLKGVDPIKKTFILEVEYQTLELAGKQNGGNNPQNQQVQQLIRQQQQIMRGGNSMQQMQQMRQLIAQYQRAQNGQQNGGIKVVTQHKQFEFQATKDILVRLLVLPSEFDDKGNPKRRTAEELKKLKGSNANLPGYAFDFEKLESGQMVKVHLAKNQPAPKKDKDDELASVRPYVSSIYVEKPADPVEAGKKKKK